MESESMAENKTNNMKRVRKSRWGPELPLLRNTETADESVHESSSQTNLRTLPNGTNDEHAEKEGGSSDTTLIQEHNDSCRSIEKQVSDIKQEISHEIQMEVSQPSTTPVEEKVELETSDKNQVNNTDQEVSNSEIIGNNTSLTQDLNSGAQHNEPSEKSQKEKSGIVNIETTCAISVKPLKDLIKPKDTTETQLVISSQNVLSVSSECTTGHATTSYLNSESEIIKSSENTILANKEIQQESSEDKSHDTRYFYGFDSVSDKYSKFLKMLETIRMNTKARKHMEVEQIKISIDEQKNRQLEMISERGVKKENVLDTCNETENDGVETVHGMEVESETQVESVDMLHETGSERLKGKLSEDKVMKNYYEGISRREIEKKSSKNFDVSNENLKTEGNFKINFTDAEINFTPDEPKDSDIESDKTDERNGVKGNIEDGSTLLKPNKKSRSSIKKPVYFDIANPAYLKPFDYGWKRELVFRSTNEGSNKRNSDVYYYTPKGKKVRSFREVIENLTDNELTVDNFTFFKEALGVEPEKEIIRDAKIKITKDSTSSPVEKKTQTKSKKSLSKKVSPSATPSHEDSPTSQTSNHMQTPTPPKISLTPKVVFRGAKPKLSSGPKFKVTPSRNGVPGQIQKTYSKEKKRKLSEELELEMGMLPPMWQPHDKLTPKMRDKENSTNKSASMKRPAVEQAEDSPPTKKFKKDVDIPNHMQYFMMHLSAGYLALLHAFQYLKVHELLRASRVCHMWRDIAMHKTLWETVKMKNSRVRDWEGFAQTLKKVGTRHLDLRKMLVPDTQEALHTMWMEFSKAIAKVNSLRRLDLCKCSSRLIEQVAAACPYLEGLSAHTIRSSHLNLSCLEKCKTLMDLRLKGASNSIEVSNIVSLKSLNKLRFLSLTSVQNLSEDIVVVLENLPHLESLELGECDRLPNKFVTESLPKLTKLKRLRLEKGTGPDCPTVSLLEAVSKCSQLTQLELVNFDIKQGFDTALGLCTNIKTLLIIPTYITQSATTNHLVMEGVSKLSKTLTHFVWGLTLELLRVTDLFIDQWEVQRSGTKPQSSGKRPGSGDSIPILKPDKSAAKKDGGTPLQVDVLQLPKLHKVLTTLLPVTKIRILKVPFIATWRQTVTGATQ